MSAWARRSSRASWILAGKRYLQATFPVTNNCGRTLINLTYVAVRRLGASPTIGGSAITSMKTATGSDAAPSLALQIKPTQPVYNIGTSLIVNQASAGLQVFDDAAGEELDGLQAQVDPNRTTYDLLPYGFLTTAPGGSRGIGAGASGLVTFAVSLPIQPSSAQDVFSFNLLMRAVTNTVFSVTQGLEEQTTSGKLGAQTRATPVSGDHAHPHPAGTELDPSGGACRQHPGV